MWSRNSTDPTPRHCRHFALSANSNSYKVRISLIILRIKLVRTVCIFFPRRPLFLRRVEFLVLLNVLRAFRSSDGHASKHDTLLSLSTNFPQIAERTPISKWPVTFTVVWCLLPGACEVIRMYAWLCWKYYASKHKICAPLATCALPISASSVHCHFLNPQSHPSSATPCGYHNRKTNYLKIASHKLLSQGIFDVWATSDGLAKRSRPDTHTTNTGSF